jgi:hypothetical protein
VFILRQQRASWQKIFSWETFWPWVSISSKLEFAIWTSVIYPSNISPSRIQRICQDRGGSDGHEGIDWRRPMSAQAPQLAV